MLRSTAARLAPAALSAPAVTQALQSLPGWRCDGNRPNSIERDYNFKDFTAAMDFMNRVAPVCERLAHHPKWTNVYNRLHVELTTHDAGNKVTQRDMDLAAAMNETFVAHGY